MFYDQPSGLFYDYILDERQRSNILSPAALWPYWSFGADESNTSHDGGAHANAAFSPVSRILGKSPGGFPATLYNSGQQWDYPSVWPPLQYVLMQGALNTGHVDLATQLAQTFVHSVLCAWYKTGGSIPGILEKLPNTTDSGHMFEKFDSTQVGKEGGGGEYNVQAGFGWTNGVLIWTLDTFGKSLTAIALIAALAVVMAEHEAAAAVAPAMVVANAPAGVPAGMPAAAAPIVVPVTVPAQPAAGAPAPGTIVVAAPPSAPNGAKPAAPANSKPAADDKKPVASAKAKPASASAKESPNASSSDAKIAKDDANAASVSTAATINTSFAAVVLALTAGALSALY
ncbi:hypothetical protein H4S04_006272 [Coemansia sp. S16]|nr:hypothetical protein H4S04_006272 [Coemansia sp. S16]